MKRCSWCNLDNKKYVLYHDDEWGNLKLDSNYLLEILLLESFQAGLSWECVLNKREHFKEAYDNFDINKIVLYDEDKINELINNKNIIRNKLKIKGSIKNAKIFQTLENEFGSFENYLRRFWDGNIIYENKFSANKLSLQISHDLRKRGMTFVGSIIIYSYLQAIGIINSHENDCFLYKE